LDEYRENGVNLAKIAAKKLAEDASIPVALKSPRVRKKTKLFDYKNVDKPVLHNEHRFRTNYFFIVDEAILYLRKKHLETVRTWFGSGPKEPGTDLGPSFSHVGLLKG